MQYARYDNSTFRKDFIDNEPVTEEYDSYLNLFKYGLSGQVSKGYISERLVLSLGIRVDGSSYSEEMRNPFKQLSPRLSASYKLRPNLNLSFNIGKYYQLPPYTTMGYRNERGVLVNKENGLKYINVVHYVAGTGWLPMARSQVSFEAFYKDYSDYPGR